MRVLCPARDRGLQNLEPGTHALTARVVVAADGGGAPAGSGDDDEPPRAWPLGPDTSTAFDATLDGAAEVALHSFDGVAAAAASSAAAPPAAALAAQSPSTARISLCFVGMLKLDGQKTIWLEQLARRVAINDVLLPRHPTTGRP